MATEGPSSAPRPLPGLDQKFAEPVALSSAQPADRPLPRRALRRSLDLITLGARRRREPRRSRGARQWEPAPDRRRHDARVEEGPANVAQLLSRWAKNLTLPVERVSERGSHPWAGVLAGSWHEHELSLRSRALEHLVREARKQSKQCGNKSALLGPAAKTNLAERELARREGIFVGTSSGATLAATAAMFVWCKRRGWI